MLGARAQTHTFSPSSLHATAHSISNLTSNNRPPLSLSLSLSLSLLLSSYSRSFVHAKFLATVAHTRTQTSEIRVRRVSVSRPTVGTWTAQVLEFQAAEALRRLLERSYADSGLRGQWQYRLCLPSSPEGKYRGGNLDIVKEIERRISTALFALFVRVSFFFFFFFILIDVEFTLDAYSERFESYSLVVFDESTPREFCFSFFFFFFFFFLMFRQIEL